MGLSEWFNKLKADREKAAEVAASKKAALKAIVANDPEALKIALGGRSAAQWSADEKSELLKTAIISDNSKIFSAVLAFTGDPNATVIETSYGFRGIRTDYQIPLLTYALKNRCHDSALILARDPRTDIESLKGNFFEGAYTALERSRIDHGMRDVTAVLAGRTAELRRQEATRLEQEASMPSPT